MKHTQAATRTPNDAHTHAQAGWRRHKCTLWCSSTKVCKHSKCDAFSHTITQVGDSLHKYREEREPEIAEMWRISLTSSWAQAAPTVSPHREEVHCISIHAFIACKTIKCGLLSDTPLNGEKELYGWLATVSKCSFVTAGLSSQGQEFHLNNFTTK